MHMCDIKQKKKDENYFTKLKRMIGNKMLFYHITELKIK